jgi:hypothetical protein
VELRNYICYSFDAYRYLLIVILSLQLSYRYLDKKRTNDI